MIFKHQRATLFMLALFGCMAISLAGDASGYVYVADSSSSSNAMQETASGITYDDNDLVNMIAHNIGLLDPSSELKASTKDAISKFGSKAFLKQQKINYLFLVESSTSTIVDTEAAPQAQGLGNHRRVSSNVCSGEHTKDCVLNLLYNANHEKSLVNLLKKSAKKNKVEAYLYSSGANTALSYKKNALSLKSDANGNLFIQDNGSNKAYKLKTDLSQCVNNLLDGLYKVSLPERSISPLTENGQGVIIDSAHEAQFVQFMTDICSISSISNLIRKDPNPSFFTFYINSLAKLEKLVNVEQGKELHKIFNIAYKKFIQNIKQHYTKDEISGQVFVLNPADSIEKKYESIVSKEEAPEVTVLFQARVLEATTETPKASSSDPTTQVIFKSVLIGFILISLWIWMEMFNMEIQKDTIVYAKFLTADYFKR